MATNKHLSIGRLGEEVATKYLENRGFRTVERNYRQKWGEIDIVVQKDRVLHFVEVKAGGVSSDFPKEGSDRYRPEDHMHREKCARLRRVIETFVHERNVVETMDWTVDLVVVLINEHTKKARVRVLWDILL